jgi:hypothetical protein
MKKALMVSGTLVIGILILLSACSSDKNTSPAKTKGSDNDPAYIQAQSLARAYVDSISAFAADGFSYMNFDGTGPLKVASDSACIRFDSTSHWWIIYAHDDTTDVNFTYIDSVRFEEGSGHQQLPDSLTTTGIEYRTSTDFDLTADSAAIGGIFAENFHVTGIQAEQVVFNGLSTAEIALTINQGSYGQTYNSSMTDITFSRADLEIENNVHPLSGAMTMAMTIHSQSQQGASNMAWNINVTFFPDHYSIHFESGDNYWDWDGPYGG